MNRKEEEKKVSEKAQVSTWMCKKREDVSDMNH